MTDKLTYAIMIVAQNIPVALIRPYSTTVYVLESFCKLLQVTNVYRSYAFINAYDPVAFRQTVTLCFVKNTHHKKEYCGHVSNSSDVPMKYIFGRACKCFRIQRTSKPIYAPHIGCVPFYLPKLMFTWFGNTIFA